MINKIILGILFFICFSCGFYVEPDVNYFKDSFNSVREKFFERADHSDTTSWILKDENGVNYYLSVESSPFVARQTYRVTASKQIRFPDGSIEIYSEGLVFSMGDRQYKHFKEHYIIRPQNGFRDEELDDFVSGSIWREVLSHFFGG